MKKTDPHIARIGKGLQHKCNMLPVVIIAGIVEAVAVCLPQNGQ